MAEDRKPILVVVAGANGSGKTTLTQQLLLDKWLKGVEYLNPDAIAQERFGGWNDPKAIVQAADFVAEAREAALAKYESIAFETVFSAPDKLDYVRRAKQAGFFVRIFYVCTASPEINAARVVDRFYLWDNSLQGHPPRRVLRVVDGRLAREYEAPPHEVAALLRDAIVKNNPPSPASRKP